MIDHKRVWINYLVESNPLLAHYDMCSYGYVWRTSDICIVLMMMCGQRELKFSSIGEKRGSNIHRVLMFKTFYYETQVFTPSKHNSRNIATWSMQLKIIRQLVPQNPFATPVRVNSAAQWDNMSSQILVNTDSGNGTRLLLKPVFTVSSMGFSGSLLHHFDLLPNVSSVPTSPIHVVSSLFFLYPWYSCCHLHM